jgi:hypothetical protein
MGGMMKELILQENDDGKVAVEFYPLIQEKQWMIRIYETNEKGDEEFAYAIPADYILRIYEWLTAQKEGVNG